MVCADMYILTLSHYGICCRLCNPQTTVLCVCVCFRLPARQNECWRPWTWPAHTLQLLQWLVLPHQPTVTTNLTRPPSMALVLAQVGSCDKSFDYFSPSRISWLLIRLKVCCRLESAFIFPWRSYSLFYTPKIYVLCFWSWAHPPLFFVCCSCPRVASSLLGNITLVCNFSSFNIFVLLF